jgi:hypothetical protein
MRKVESRFLYASQNQELCYDRRSVGQSAGVGHPSGANNQIHTAVYYCLFTWGTISDERRGP